MEMQIASSRRAKERSDKHRLRVETSQWQKAAIGLFAVSMTLNMAQYARIISLEQTREADTARYLAQIERLERTRDLAVQELGALSIRQAREQEARAELAAAYEMIGEYRYIGECTITAYCPCAECCGRWADGLTATGLPAGPGIVAVDPEVIPLGSTIIIDGQRYLAADTGVKGLHVDVCMEDHVATVEAGVRSAEVWVVEP